MELTEDLQRLAQLRDAGELSPEQYEAEKNRLLDVAVDRIENWPNKRGTPLITRRAIRGSVKSIDFSRLKNTATLWIGKQKITIERIGKPIQISACDRVLVVASTDGENIQANLHINETNGDESVSEWRKPTRKVIWAGLR
ncbi:MAG TPA: SHOCT domain-containing protein [Bryobacteraceae bacterium]|nr:SHOCT domain-containing protein [Bryobacteraceae bacterium]